MKKQTLLSLVLVALDQAIKLVITRFALHTQKILIPGALRFSPVKNTNLNWLASMADFHTPEWLMVVFQFAMLAVVVLLFRYLTYRTRGNQPLLRVFFSFGAAGICCSFIDVVFWGGSLDFLGLFNWFVFDTKDVFLNTAVFALAIWLTGRERERERKRIEASSWAMLFTWVKKGCPMKRLEGQLD